MVHHGAECWNAPCRLHELVEGIEELPELAPLVPDFEHLPRWSREQGVLTASRPEDLFED